jgi:hypothetical protein
MCLAVPVHLEIFHLCFSFCNIIENVVKKKKKNRFSNNDVQIFKDDK